MPVLYPQKSDYDEIKLRCFHDTEKQLCFIKAIRGLNDDLSFNKANIKQYFKVAAHDFEESIDKAAYDALLDKCIKSETDPGEESKTVKKMYNCWINGLMIMIYPQEQEYEEIRISCFDDPDSYLCFTKGIGGLNDDLTFNKARMKQFFQETANIFRRRRIDEAKYSALLDRCIKDKADPGQESRAVRRMFNCWITGLMPMVFPVYNVTVDLNCFDGRPVWGCIDFELGELNDDTRYKQGIMEDFREQFDRLPYHIDRREYVTLCKRCIHLNTKDEIYECYEDGYDELYSSNG